VSRIRLALLLALACSRSSSPPDTSGFAAGETFLVIDDYVVMRLTIERADAREVIGSLFGSSRTYPRDSVIPVRTLGTAGCPQPGRIALVKTTESMWDIGLSLGLDGERCYLQEHAGTTQRAPGIVYELPAQFEPRLAKERADFERRRATRGWIARRPDNWIPNVGDDVVLALSTGLRPAKVVERRAGAVRITRGGAFKSDTIDEWRAVRDLAPLPSGSAPTTATATVCMTDDASRCLERLPPAAVKLPEITLADDVIARSLAFTDLMIELGAIHAIKPTARPGTLVFVLPDGTPVAETRYELALAQAPDGFFSMGWVLDRKEPTVTRPATFDGAEHVIYAKDVMGILERLAVATKATAFKKLDRDVVLLYEIRIVLPEAKRPQLGNASARFAAELAK
jgi:hypothetical protein